MDFYKLFLRFWGQNVPFIHFFYVTLTLYDLKYVRNEFAITKLIKNNFNILQIDQMVQFLWVFFHFSLIYANQVLIMHDNHMQIRPKMLALYQNWKRICWWSSAPKLVISSESAHTCPIWAITTCTIRVTTSLNECPIKNIPDWDCVWYRLIVGQRQKR